MNLSPIDKDAESLEQFIDSYIDPNDDRSSWYTEMLRWYASKPEIQVITEFGIFQGQSLAVFLSVTPKLVQAFDIDTQYVPDRTLLRLKSPKTELVISQRSSLDPNLYVQGDLLFLDTVHKYDHVLSELYAHGGNGYKYIAVHDANYPPAYKRGNDPRTVRDACYKYIANTGAWEIDFDTAYLTGLLVMRRK